MSDRDCQHGQLARACDRCADAAEIEQLRAEVERLRGITNTPHFKPRSRAELKYLSHDELVSDVIRFELKYLHRSSMFIHLDQSHEKLRAELAASRECEAELQLILSRVAGWDHRGSALWEEYERHYSEPWPCPPDDIEALAEEAKP